MTCQFKHSAWFTMLILLAPMLAVSCKKDSTNTQQQTTTTTTTPTTTDSSNSTTINGKKYKLLWSDEFNSTTINTSNWGFDTGNLHVNNEKEYYQAANAAVSDGNLVITAKQESVGGQPYTSARLTTSGKFSVRYGRIESRIKIPLGAGLWPAFWMLGNNVNTIGWPKCGEIDIMEHVNADNKIYGTIHWDNNGHVQYGDTTTTSTPDSYHIYAVEWDSSSIRWYVDNTLFGTANITNNINSTEEFNVGPFFILLNMAVAGDFPGQTVDLSKLPAKMYVDYVRVYQTTN